MKDARTSILLSLALVLFLISLALFYTWGYYKLRFKKQVAVSGTQLTNKKLPTPLNNYRDSLQKIYTAIINNINTPSGNKTQNIDSLQLHTDLKSAEFYDLKNEIAAILNNHPLKADLDVARLKIDELQSKLAELISRNINTEDENRRLNEKLSQLTKEIRGVEQKTIKRDTAVSRLLAGKPKSSSVFTVSRLHLSGVKTNNGIEQETFQAGQTEKLVGSFIIKNNFNQADDAEIVVVVIQPDGRVMQSSAWESGSFDTQEGRKIYSSKFHFDYVSGEAKQLLFSLSSDDYQKGEYAMQIYYNKKIIGKATQSLF